MLNDLTVSIGMPVFNGGLYLSESIDSLLGQTYENIELIISDNASTDRTEEICRDYAKRDSRIRYIRNDVNVGASDNYNAVFRSAGGKFFKWASCNDICDKHFIELCVRVLRDRHDVVAAYPRTRLINRENGDAQVYQDALCAEHESACHRFRSVVQDMALNNAMNGVIRSNCLRRTQLIRAYFSSDVVMMAELALQGKLVEVPEYLFFRSMDATTATALKSKEEVRRHYNPRGRKQMLFQQWKIQAGYFRAIRRASLARDEKKCLYGFMVKSTFWARRSLYSDLRDALVGFATQQSK